MKELIERLECEFELPNAKEVAEAMLDKYELKECIHMLDNYYNSYEGVSDYTDILDNLSGDSHCFSDSFNKTVEDMYDLSYTDLKRELRRAGWIIFDNFAISVDIDLN